MQRPARSCENSLVRGPPQSKSVRWRASRGTKASVRMATATKVSSRKCSPSELQITAICAAKLFAMAHKFSPAYVTLAETAVLTARRSQQSP